MRDIPKRIIIRLSRIALKQISLFYILHLSICCMISLFFLEKQSEIRNSFTFFEKWKVKKIILSLFLRNEKWNDFFFHSFREVKVKLKYLETEIEKWNFKIILENSRETRLSLVTDLDQPPVIKIVLETDEASLEKFTKSDIKEIMIIWLAHHSLRCWYSSSFVKMWRKMFKDEYIVERLFRIPLGNNPDLHWAAIQVWSLQYFT